MSKFDEINLERTRERSQFFQTVQAWPLTNELNYDGWLKNFEKAKDRKIASLILDFFIYYPENMVDQMLRASVGKAGFHLAKRFSSWEHSDFKNKCFYSFIPGENPHPTDSGHIFTRKLRDVLGIPEDRIIDYMHIPNMLDYATGKTAIILVDDFVGSGAQCDKAWNNNVFTYNRMTLSQISDVHGHVFVYAPLIVNNSGFKRISDNCDSLILSPAHVLGTEYNLFNKNCPCWKGDEQLFEMGTELILRKSSQLGIPSTNGKHTQDVKGFGEQGLALKFAHGAPDAIPAFFYWQHEAWTPLFFKQYER